MCVAHTCCVPMNVCFVIFHFCLIDVYAYDIKSKVHCANALTRDI